MKKFYLVSKYSTQLYELDEKDMCHFKKSVPVSIEKAIENFKNRPSVKTYGILFAQIIEKNSEGKWEILEEMISPPSPVKNFYKSYLDIQDTQSRLVGKAKRFAIRNWGKVKDWSKLRIHMRDGRPLHDITVFYGPTHLSILKKKVMREKIESVNIVLDEVDGDFSVNINGRDWFWIPDDLVIEITLYIQKNI